MARNVVVRVFGYPTALQLAWFGVSLGLWMAACWVYAVTLEGGDLEYLKEKTNYFAGLLMCSVVLVLAAVLIARATLSTRNSALKSASLAFGLLLLLYTVTRDLGTDLSHHGQFNLIVYFLMWLPVMGCVLTYEGCCAARKKVDNARV